MNCTKCGRFSGVNHKCPTSTENPFFGKHQTGSSNPFYGKHHSDETKKLIGQKNREKRKGIKFTSEHKKKIGEALKNRSFSQESLEKMKLNNRTRMKIWRGKKYDEIFGIEIAQRLKKQRSTFLKAYRKQIIVPNKDTSIEVDIQNALRSEGVLFCTHYPVFGQPDIIIFDDYKKIAIFADGCYWHGCSLCGFVNKERVKRDQLVTQKLTRRGWIVLRFWEHEIKNDLSEVVQRIKREASPQEFPITICEKPLVA